MGKISFVPFGRGSVSTGDDIQDAYDALQGLSDGAIDWENFSAYAGISEKFFSWDRHNHEDGTLADGCIRLPQLKFDAGNADACMLTFTHAPQCLVLFGFKTYDQFFGEVTDEDTSLYVDFAETSRTRQAFYPGTVPCVLYSIYGALTTATKLGHLFLLREVTSQGFTLTTGDFYYQTRSAACSGTLFYVAYGQAPGVVSQQGAV